MELLMKMAKYSVNMGLGYFAVGTKLSNNHEMGITSYLKEAQMNT